MICILVKQQACEGVDVMKCNIVLLNKLKVTLWGIWGRKGRRNCNH